MKLNEKIKLWLNDGITWVKTNMPYLRDSSKEKFNIFSLWLSSLSWGKFILFVIITSIISDALQDILFKESLQQFFSNLTTMFIFGSFGIKIFINNKVKSDERVKSAEHLAETEKLKCQLVEARIQVMQAQIEPHFLFNTLSSLQYLIEQDTKKASKMLTALVTYLRYALPEIRENQPMNTLGKEIENIHAYLDIMEVRMGDRLNVEYDISEELKYTYFPTMMLQPIVENAIKYGIEESIDGGEIKITAKRIEDNLEVSVSDTGVGLGNAKSSGNGLALNNIKSRLEMLYGDKDRLILSSNEPKGVVVKIKIPLNKERCQYL